MREIRCSQGRVSVQRGGESKSAAESGWPGMCCLSLRNVAAAEGRRGPQGLHGEKIFPSVSARRQSRVIDRTDVMDVFMCIRLEGIVGGREPPSCPESGMRE